MSAAAAATIARTAATRPVSSKKKTSEVLRVLPETGEGKRRGKFG